MAGQAPAKGYKEEQICLKLFARIVSYMHVLVRIQAHVQHLSKRPLWPDQICIYV